MPIRIRSLTAIVLCLLIATPGAGAPAAAPPVEGKDYRLLTPARPTASPGKIEVVEFFSYGCPHCARFNPLVSAWLATQPQDVAFRRVPVSYGRPQWVNLARAYYALEASGDLKRLDAALFRAIHDEHQELFDEQSIADWVGKHGGDEAGFANAYVSFSVNNQTFQADQMAEDYAITGIPALAVAGRYVVNSPGEAADELQTFKEVLALADKVIALARSTAPRPATAAAKAPAAKQR